MGYLPQIGLLSGFVGTIFVTMAIGKLKSSYAPFSDDPETGRKIHFAFINKPKLLKCGLIFIGVGFLIQLIFSFL